MLILLYGEDTFRLKQKLNEIVEKYKAKHKSGLNLVFFRKENLDLERIRQIIEAISMFEEKKLLVLENPFSNKAFWDNFLTYSKKNKLKNNQDVVSVICQEGKLATSSFKRQLSMFEEFKFLPINRLTAWAKREISEKNGKITSGALNKLVAYVGQDLWQMTNEIDKLIAFKKEKLIEEKDVDLLIKSKVDNNIFKTLDALSSRDKKTAYLLLHKHMNSGENEFYLFSMLAYQMRTLLKLKSLMDKGISYHELSRQSGLHPYVVRKSQSQLKGFTLDQLKKIYRRLLKFDLYLKTGRLDGLTALDLFVAEI